jgi:pilus assembly protein Flp/PilA
MLAYIRKTTRKAQDRGASAVEYGLMVAAIAAIIVGVVFGLGNLVKTNLGDTCNTIAAETSPTQTACPNPLEEAEDATT